jgi:hypothetical protein
MAHIITLIILSTACIIVACDSKDLTVQSLTLVNEHYAKNGRTLWKAP